MPPSFNFTFQCDRCLTVTFCRQPLELKFQAGGIIEYGAIGADPAPSCSRCGQAQRRAPWAPLVGDRLRRLLEQIWSPSLLKIGLQPRRDGKSWVQPGQSAIRKLVQLTPLKDARAVARIGLSLPFVPTPGRNSLSYHRSASSAHADVFQVFPESHLAARPASDTFPILSFENPLVARRTFADCAGLLIERAYDWFARLQDLDSIERHLRLQLEEDLYPNSYPRPAYTLAFIAAHRGDPAEARRLLQLVPGYLPPEIEEAAIRNSGRA